VAPDRRNKIVLAALVAVAAVVLSRAWRTSEIPPSSNGAAGAPPGVRSSRAQPSAPPADPFDVHLQALKEDRAKPGVTERNLFRFKPKAAPAPPPSAPGPVLPQLPPVAAAPAGPPPPPPITLKFIGIVDRADKSERLAVLSDGRGGVPISGKEGDIIEGRYRILRIGNESIEMAYLDGRGRQTIRLSGS